MWLGEQITERGIGNGISLIIFAGIVASMPSGVATTFEFVRRGELPILVALFIGVLMIFVVAAIIYMERAQRRIPVQYAKRVVGRRMYSGQSSHLPLKLNTSGVIPPIFASSILLFPGTVTGFIDHPGRRTGSSSSWRREWLYNLVYVGLIVSLSYS
jgi:preprotein translocase subunit SecY